MNSAYVLCKHAAYPASTFSSFRQFCSRVMVVFVCLASAHNPGCRVSFWGWGQPIALSSPARCLGPKLGAVLWGAKCVLLCARGCEAVTAGLWSWRPWSCKAPGWATPSVW